jgi:hypothetical protein
MEPVERRRVIITVLRVQRHGVSDRDEGSICCNKVNTGTSGGKIQLFWLTAQPSMALFGAKDLIH